MAINSSNFRGQNKNTRKRSNLMGNPLKPVQKIKRKNPLLNVFRDIFGGAVNGQRGILMVVVFACIILIAGVSTFNRKHKGSGVAVRVEEKNNTVAESKKAQVDYILSVTSTDGTEKKYLIGSKVGMGQSASSSTKIKNITSIDPKVEKSKKEVDLKQFITDYEDGYTKVDFEYKQTSASKDAGVEGQIYDITYSSNVDELAAERQKKQDAKNSLTIKLTSTESKVNDSTYVVTYKYTTPANSGDEVYGISLKNGVVNVDGYIKKENEYYSIFSNEKVEKAAMSKYITTVDFNNKTEGTFKLNYGTKENADKLSNELMQKLQNAVMSAKQRQDAYLRIDNSKK